MASFWIIAVPISLFRIYLIFALELIVLTPYVESSFSRDLFVVVASLEFASK